MANPNVMPMVPRGVPRIIVGTNHNYILSGAIMFCCIVLLFWSTNHIAFHIDNVTPTLDDQQPTDDELCVLYWEMREELILMLTDIIVKYVNAPNVNIAIEYILRDFKDVISMNTMIYYHKYRQPYNQEQQYTHYCIMP